MQKNLSIRNIRSFIPILDWLPKYNTGYLKWDMIAGITLASFVLPESMAYATLAGLPTYYGIYCCLAGGFVFAFFTTSKHVAVGPTSAISLMVGTTVAVLSGGDPARWAAIAALTALAVAVICFIAFLLRLNTLVNFISDSILLGFKAGAALSIMSTQLPAFFGVEGGGSNFYERIWLICQQISHANPIVFIFGSVAMLLMLLGDKILPGKPVALIVVIASIIVLSVTNLTHAGIHVTGLIPGGMPSFIRPSLDINDLNAVIELAFACFLMGYIETISAAKTFALKNGYDVNPRQELLSLGFANLAASIFSAYVVSGGLSQSTVNEKSGAKTPMSLIICSITLTVILLYFTGLLKNMPEVILAVIVLHAVASLIKIKELKRIYQLSKVEFTVAMVAVVGVLTLGILKGVMVAVLLSLVLLIRRIAYPHVAVLGRIDHTDHYSDIERHPDNILQEHILIMRVEASLLYFNADFIRSQINENIDRYGNKLQLVVLDLSPSSYVDVEGSKMLLQISDQLKHKHIQLRIVEALATVRDILRKQGMEEMVGHISRRSSINEVVEAFKEKASKTK